MSIAEKYTTLTEKIPDVYEAGKTAQRKEHWRTFIASRTQDDGYVGGSHMFSYDHPDNFYPTEDIKPSTVSNMFLQFGMYNGDKVKPISLKQRLEECGVKLDLSNQTGVNSYMFNNTCFTELPEIAFTNYGSTSKLNYTFDASKYLERIEKLKLKNGATEVSAFRNCTALTDMVLEVVNDGKIKGSWDFHYSPLDAESAKSIIKHLYNYSGTDEDLTYTLSMHDSTWTALNESEAPPAGETWQQYVNSLGYNV